MKVVRGRWSAFAAIGLMLSVLGIAAALAYQAQQAARSHRTTAENVLRDYATFAAWEFSGNARRELSETMDRVFGSVSAGCRQTTPPDLARLKAQGG